MVNCTNFECNAELPRKCVCRAGFHRINETCVPCGEKMGKNILIKFIHRFEVVLRTKNFSKIVIYAFEAVKGE